MSFVIGVDGGGTLTRCACVASDGAVLGVARGGPSHYLRVGVEEAVENVRGVVEAAVEEAGVTLPAGAVAVCLAGIGRAPDRAVVVPRLEALGLGARLVADTDAAAALVGAHPLGPGVVVIAGTGAIACARAAAGERVRVDGWGPLLGDEGSGYWIGIRAVRAVMRASDGRGPQTALTDAVLQRLEVGSVPELVNRLPLDRTNSEDIAGLAAICARGAEAGDTVAQGILLEAGRRLAESAASAATALGLEGSVPVAVTGSVLGNPTVRRAFTHELHERLPGARVTGPALPPVLGAALMALDLAGHPVTRSVVERMQAARCEVG